MSPTSSSILIGETTLFQSVLRDTRDVTVSGSVNWSSDNPSVATIDGAGVATGMAEGSTKITASAGGQTGSATLTVAPNQPPTATISAPASGSSFVQGTSVSFQGSATDREDGTLTGGALVWTSSEDGQIGTGTGFSRSDLSVGSHTITLRATDSNGASVTKSISLSIKEETNQLPSATITSPTNGSTFAQGASVPFQGSATDPEDGALSGAALVWSSSIDDQIGTGTSFSHEDLSVGSHTITLKATDSDGASVTTTVGVGIDVPPNQAPSATVSAPADGSSFVQGTSVSFQGSATDPEDGILTGGSLVWTSSKEDNQIGTGTSFSTSSLGLGFHTITLTAMDSGGLTGTESISVSITAVPNHAPTAKIDVPTKDTTVSAGAAAFFMGTGTDSDGFVAGHSWDFGDGYTASVEDPGAHAFANAGTYTVRYTVVDNQGEWSPPASVDVTVEQGPGTDLSGLWHFRSHQVGSSFNSSTTAVLLVAQTGNELAGEARRIVKRRVFSSTGTVSYKGHNAQAILSGSATGSQVEFSFNDTEGLSTYAGIYHASRDSISGSTWYAIRSTDPPPPSVDGSATGLSALLVPGPRVQLMWTDNASNEHGFAILQSCQVAPPQWKWESKIGADFESHVVWGMPYGGNCLYVTAAFVEDTWNDEYGSYEGTVFSKSSNVVEIFVPESLVTEISPAAGFVGDLATVKGMDFGSDEEAISVAVNDYDAFIFFWLISPGEIGILMPSGGIQGRMPVTVFKNGYVYGETVWVQKDSVDVMEPINNDYSTAKDYQHGSWVGSFSHGDWKDWYKPTGTSDRLRLRFYLDWNEDKNLDLYVERGYGGGDICGNMGIGAEKPISFECEVVGDGFGNVGVRVVDQDAKAGGDTRLVSYHLYFAEP